MTGTARNMTPGQVKDLACALAQCAPTDLTFEEAKQLGANKNELISGVRGLISGLTERKSLPTELTIGGRTYDILSFLKEGEDSIIGHEMVKRAKELNAHLGKDDREHLLKHQNEIPTELRGNVYFVFTDEPHPDDPDLVAYVRWYSGLWYCDWPQLGSYWFGHARVLCPRK